MNNTAELSVDFDAIDFSNIHGGGNRLIKNKKIKGQDKKVHCYSFEPYAQELFDMYVNGDFPINTKKDLEKGDLIGIKSIKEIRGNHMMVELDTGINMDISLTKEKKLLELFGYNTSEEFIEALQKPEILASILAHDLQVYVSEVKPNVKASIWDAYKEKIYSEFINEISNPSKAYIAKVKEANKGGYFVEVQGINAFMPGSLAAANKLANFEDLLNKEVVVMIEDFIPEMNSFIVSHKKYIAYILPSKLKELDLTAKYKGTITGTSKYGIFIEFNEIFTGLLHTSKMLDDTVAKFKQREYKPGDDIEFYINEITKDNRLILTESDPVEKQRQLDAFVEKIGTAPVLSTIAAVMNFGIIVNVDEHTGLIPNKEFRRKRMNPSVYQVGDEIGVIFDNLQDNKITFALPE